MDPTLVAGTLELLILDVLARGDNYGYQIAQIVVNRSQGLFDIKEGSLYPALHRLERRTLIKGYWVEPDGIRGGRRRKYYALTAEGRTARRAKRNEWSQFTKAVGGVLGVKHVMA